MFIDEYVFVSVLVVLGVAAILAACIVDMWRVLFRPPKQGYVLWKPGNGRWEKVCEFIDASDSFAYGFECGSLYERMKHVFEIHDDFHATNQQQIIELAQASGWTIHHTSLLQNGRFVVHMTDTTTERNILPFLPPDNYFTPPTEWQPDEREEDNE